MAYVCETLQLVNNVQTCVSWVMYTEPDFFKSVAITGAQAKVLYVEFGKILALFLGFVIVAKATKLL